VHTNEVNLRSEQVLHLQQEGSSLLEHTLDLSDRLVVSELYSGNSILQILAVLQHSDCMFSMVAVSLDLVNELVAPLVRSLE